MPSRPTILLTGFGAFPGVPVNATGLLVPAMAPRIRRAHPGIAVRTAVLPTEWRRGPGRAEAVIARERPDLVLHFGVSARAHGFVIERVATGACMSYPDATGALPPPGAAGAVGRYRSTVPWELIVARLRTAGFPAEASDDAGGYLCNAVLYRTLSLPDGLRPRLAGFVHIPVSLAGHGPSGKESAPDAPLTQAQAVAGACEIVAACLAELGVPAGALSIAE